MAVKTPLPKEEQERQKILADAQRLAGQNTVSHEGDPIDKKFENFVQHCNQKIKEFEKLNLTEANEWRKLQSKIQHIQTNVKTIEVNLSQHPPLDKIVPVQPGSQLTIGDTHGNSMKLVYFLIRQGVLTLANGSKDYDELVRLYQKDPLAKGDLTKFENIIAQATLNPGASIRLIGDEVGDRGANDYFNLKIIEKLNKGMPKIPLETLYSDHGAEFIDFYEKGCPPNYKAPNLQGGQARSVENLSKLVQQGLITSEELQKLITENYIPNLKAISYTIDETNNHITLHSHAPVGLETIKALAAKFKVPYDESSPRALAQTIDKINLQFGGLADQKKITKTLSEEDKIWLKEIWNKAIITSVRSSDLDKIVAFAKSVAEKFMMPLKYDNLDELVETIYQINTTDKFKIELLTEEELAWLAVIRGKFYDINDEQRGPSGASYAAPLNRIIWSRYENDPQKELENQKKIKLDFSFSNIHGHDARGSVPAVCNEYVKNLDDELGKDPRGLRQLDSLGHYRIHCNFEMSAQQYQHHLRNKTETVAQLPKPTRSEEMRDISEIRRESLETSESLTPSDRESPKTMLTAHTMAKESSHKRQTIVAAAEITPEKIQSSFERIKNNIEQAKNNQGSDENKIYKAATIVQSDPNNLKVRIDYGAGKMDEMTRTVSQDNMVTTLSRNSNDSSFLLFCDMNKEFSPLTMTKECKDDSLALPLKILEAAIIRNISIELNEEDKKKFAILPSDDPRKVHYELLQKHPEEFLSQISNIKNRKLGEPFSEEITLTARKP